MRKSKYKAHNTRLKKQVLRNANVKNYKIIISLRSRKAMSFRSKRIYRNSNRRIQLQCKYKKNYNVFNLEDNLGF